MSDYLPKPKRSKSQKQEKKLAKRLDGKVTPGSGSGSMKGDVSTMDEMIEAKTTSKTQYTLKLRDLQKLEREAQARGKRPVFVIQIDDDSPLNLFDQEYVVIPMREYERLTRGDDDV